MPVQHDGSTMLKNLCLEDFGAIENVENREAFAKVQDLNAPGFHPYRTLNESRERP